MITLQLTFLPSLGTAGPEIEARTKIYFDALDKIPTNRISESFSHARKTCAIFPKPKDILDAWRTVKNADFDKVLDWNGDAATSKQMVEIVQKYPEFTELFKSINLRTTEMPSNKWKNEFFRLAEKRLGFNLNSNAKVNR